MPPVPPWIETFEIGPFATNAYLVRAGGRDDRRCWLIDAPIGVERVLARMENDRLEPEALVLTHAHADHIAGIPAFKDRYPDTAVLLHRAEEDWLERPEKNLSAFFGMPLVTPPADRLLDGGERLDLAGRTWAVLNTPGHSPGGITLHDADSGVAFVGDTLFAGSIGRHDFPGSSFETLADSIRSELYALPDDTLVLPGHGPETTIGEEKRSNPFVPAGG